MQLLIHPSLPQTFFARVSDDYAVIKGHSISRFGGETSTLIEMCAPVAKIITLSRPSLEADVKAVLSWGL